MPIVQRTWNMGDGAVLTNPGQSFQYIYPNPGVYTVSLVVTDDLNRQSAASQTITVTTPLVTVPNIVGLTEVNAQLTLQSVGLIMAVVLRSYSSTVPAGVVISQNPLSGTQAPPGSTVSLDVSAGPPPPTAITVPMVVGLAEATALNTLLGAGLNGIVMSRPFSSTAPAGIVIAQIPLGGTQVAPGSTVNLDVSAGPPPPTAVNVPSVVGLDEATALNTIAGAGLVGIVASRPYSNIMAVGFVLSQNPPGGSQLAPGSTVNLDVSAGPIPTVTVPNLVGLTEADALNTLTGVGLVGVVSARPYASVPVGVVIGQSLVGGTQVSPNTSVYLDVSAGPQPPTTVAVPNVVGLAENTAVNTIMAAGLVSNVASRPYSSTVAAGIVISQNPVGGTQVASGTTVALEISAGSQPPPTTALAQFSDLGSLVAPTAVQFYNQSQNAVSILWEFGDGSISSEQNPVHTYRFPGIYLVTLRATAADGTTAVARRPVVALPPIFRELSIFALSLFQTLGLPIPQFPPPLQPP